MYIFNASIEASQSRVKQKNRPMKCTAYLLTKMNEIYNETVKK
jgi:hypothetical protein